MFSLIFPVTQKPLCVQHGQEDQLVLSVDGFALGQIKYIKAALLFLLSQAEFKDLRLALCTQKSQTYSINSEQALLQDYPT